MTSGSLRDFETLMVRPSARSNTEGHAGSGGKPSAAGFLAS